MPSMPDIVPSLLLFHNLVSGKLDCYTTSVKTLSADAGCKTLQHDYKCNLLTSERFLFMPIISLLHKIFHDLAQPLLKQLRTHCATGTISNSSSAREDCFIKNTPMKFVKSGFSVKAAELWTTLLCNVRV